MKTIITWYFYICFSSTENYLTNDFLMIGWINLVYIFIVILMKNVCFNSCVSTKTTIWNRENIKFLKQKRLRLKFYDTTLDSNPYSLKTFHLSVNSEFFHYKSPIWFVFIKLFTQMSTPR